ncbi:MAG: AMP-binding protein [Bauldia sp.]|nr:AMP-binding protein [Bauldia sp.]
MTISERLPWSPSELLAGLQRLGDRPVVQSVVAGTVETLTGAQLHRRIAGTAAALARADCGRGTVVALWAPNSARWIEAGLACHYLGAVLAPIDALLPASEAHDQAIASGAGAILVDGDAAEMTGLRCFDLSELDLDQASVPAAALGPDDPIALFRTSGTTGAPKAFRLSLGNIGWNVRAIAETGLVGPDDRVLMPLPMHHVFPWITATLSSLTVGATLVLPEAPTGPQIAEALRLGRPTVIAGVPRLYEAMLAGIRERIRSSGGRLARIAFDGGMGLAVQLRRHSEGKLGGALLGSVRRAVAPDLRLVVSGGAHLPQRVQEELEALGWDVRVGYGLAETAASVAGTLVAKRAASVGKPIEGCEVRIDSPGPDGIGEILLRGPVVFSGYIDNPDANAQAFTPDGFFRTGDLGRLDADGFLYVTGRKKEVIVLAGGDNLYPDDVERRYLADPQIAEIGVMERDGALVALIVPNLAEITKAGALKAEDAIRVALGTVATRLPPTWRLAGFALTREPLPRTRLGKLRRFRLPELYERARAGGGQAEPRVLTAEERAWIDTPPRAAVWAILAQRQQGQPFDLDSHLQLDLGLDSFDWMSLAVSIEEATGVRLDSADTARIATVRDLLTRVSTKEPDRERHRADFDETIARERARWLSPATPVERGLAGVLAGANKATMRLFFRLHARGVETLPTTGPLLICPNHVSDMDAFVVAAALPAALRRRIAWAAIRQRVFHTPFHRAFARIARIFPVDETAPTIAVELAIETLAKGGVQVWFPEGWRSPDGKLLPFHSGVGHVILRSRAPVVPVYIAGTFEAWPRDRRFPHPTAVTVTFGEPLAADALIAGIPEGADPAQALADAVRAGVARIAGEAPGEDDDAPAESKQTSGSG